MFASICGVWGGAGVGVHFGLFRCFCFLVVFGAVFAVFGAVFAPVFFFVGGVWGGALRQCSFRW